MSVEVAAIQGLGLFSLALIIIGNKLYEIMDKIPDKDDKNPLRAALFTGFLGSYFLAVFVGTFNLWMVNSLLYANNVSSSLASPLNLMDKFLMVIVGFELGVGLIGGFMLAGNAFVSWRDWSSSSVETYSK